MKNLTKETQKLRILGGIVSSIALVLITIIVYISTIQYRYSKYQIQYSYTLEKSLNELSDWKEVVKPFCRGCAANYEAYTEAFKGARTHKVVFDSLSSYNASYGFSIEPSVDTMVFNSYQKAYEINSIYSAKLDSISNSWLEENKYQPYKLLSNLLKLEVYE